MSSGLLVGLELVLVLGGVLAFAVWELIGLRRDRERERNGETDDERDGASGVDKGADRPDDIPERTPR